MKRKRSQINYEKIFIVMDTLLCKMKYSVTIIPNGSEILTRFFAAPAIMITVIMTVAELKCGKAIKGGKCFENV